MFPVEHLMVRHEHMFANTQNSSIINWFKSIESHSSVNYEYSLGVKPQTQTIKLLSEVN